MGQGTIAVLVVAVLTCLVQQGAALQRLLQQQPQQLTAFQQCGGTRSCRFGAACSDRTWPDTYCPQGYTCRRYDAGFWQCKPGTGVQSSNKQQPPQQKQHKQQQQQQQQKQPTVKAFDQCGGNKCKQGNCGDNPWATCPGGYACVRRDQWYWQCRSQTTGWNSNANTAIKQEQGSNKPRQASNANSVPAKKSPPNDPDAPVIQEVDESVINRMTAVPSPSPPPPPPRPRQQPAQQQPQPQPAQQQPQPAQQQPFFFPFFG